MFPPLRQRREDILARYGTELGLKEPSIHPEALHFLAFIPAGVKSPSKDAGG